MNVLVRRFGIGFLGVLLLTAGSVHPVQQKFDDIENGRVASGSRLDLREGNASGFARIDFVKLKQASDSGTAGFLLRRLFSGERPVSVTARFESRNGRARVDVERVEISGVLLEGPALEFLIQTYLWASFPNARANEWFALDRHVDHFAVHANGVSVFVK